MENKYMKNLDKQYAGVDCYDKRNGVWVTITSISGCDRAYCFVVGDNGACYRVPRADLFPFAGTWVRGIKCYNVCYNVTDDDRYDYYCPETDLFCTKKQIESGFIEETADSHDSCSARAIIQSLTNELGSIFYTKFGVKIMKRNFIKAYICEAYEKDGNVFAPLVSMSLSDYLDEIICTELLHKCWVALAPAELDHMPCKDIEDLRDKVNCLEYPILLAVYDGDEEVIRATKKELGIDELMEKWCKKNYSVEVNVNQKFIVEVEAHNEKEARDRAVENIIKTAIRENSATVTRVNTSTCKETK